jgi:two-component system response regulator DesR
MFPSPAAAQPTHVSGRPWRVLLLGIGIELGLQLAVELCTEGSAARALVESGARFDLALVDVELNDGVELVRYLASERPECSTVAFAADGDGEALRLALEAGATGYVLKQTPHERLPAAVLSAATGA